MKKRPVLFITATLFLFAGSRQAIKISFAKVARQDTIRGDRKPDTHADIFIHLPEGLDTMAFAASVQLKPGRAVHKIQFPSGGTQTAVYIYDKHYLGTLRAKQAVKPLVEGHFTGSQEVIIDISALQPDLYYVHYMSCNLGGIFLLTVKK